MRVSFAPRVWLTRAHCIVMRLIPFLILITAHAVAQAGSVTPTVAPAQSQSAATQTAAPPIADENSQKAKTLVDQMIQALGGQAYLNVRDMKQEGRTYSFYHGETQGAGAPFWRFWKFPDKDRIELTKKRDWIIINNGDQGYEITFRGTALQERKQLQDYLRRRKYALDLVLRTWLNQPGVALLYEGSAVAAQ